MSFQSNIHNSKAELMNPGAMLGLGMLVGRSAWLGRGKGDVLLSESE
jgi:hypothetical protein